MATESNQNSKDFGLKTSADKLDFSKVLSVSTSRQKKLGFLEDKNEDGVHFQNLWSIVENGYTDYEYEAALTNGERDKLNENRTKNAKALLLIQQQGLSDAIFPRIVTATAAKVAWDILQKKFQGDAKVTSIKLQSLRGQLENLKMKDFEEAKDLSTLSIQELMGSLLAHEQRNLRHVEKLVESAFQSKLNLRSQKNNHMTGDDKVFLRLDTSVKSQVKMGNGAVVQTKDRYKIYDNSKGDQLIANIKMEKNRSYPVEFKYMQNPSQIHYGAARRVLRYLQGTLDYGILYEVAEEVKLFGYTDRDWAGSIDDRKSTSGYAFTLGTGVISWASKKQLYIAQSSTEAKGSLATILSRDEEAKGLDWPNRVNVIKGVAHALSYMHDDCSQPIVHRDLSSNNVLLDSEYEAYVSDFGTAKLLKLDSSN
ncbi:hypothetical protein RJ639_033536 [Escallonia herrerae]|uniref:non-specific serine/threonine protein kinase n=1 Tax=Escallonia herrerae TaxID=1293975 RepID=A0AA89BJF3_9ASTE|nr:hypothetical protein RJ639_033536 [Escallonia herrerae]